MTGRQCMMLAMEELDMPEWFIDESIHDADREQDVHGWTGNRNQQPLPTRMRDKLSRVSRASIHRVFAGHLDVSAKRKGADPVIGIAALKSE